MSGFHALPSFSGISVLRVTRVDVVVVLLSCCYMPHLYILACVYTAGLAECMSFLIIHIIVIQDFNKLSDFVAVLRRT